MTAGPTAGRTTRPTMPRCLPLRSPLALQGEATASLNADGQSSLRRQSPQWGRKGEQTVCPNPTSSGLISTCCRAT
eukprot:6790630-Pyramimonas_sp.AAC.1